MTARGCSLETRSEESPFRILVADSGLGGLAVCAGIEESSRRSALHRHLELVYVNALPHRDWGYNALPDTAEKVRVFDDALRGMMSLAPDLVLVACNTLSVLYPLTDFSRSPAAPVTGIVDFGVDMVAERLEHDPRACAIILATPTTIASQAHRQRLVERGIGGERIVGQPCPGLESEIQKAPAGARVRR